MFIQRDISEAVLKCANYFPVITITGPRQSGKTTLIRQLFPDLPYVSFENLDVRDHFQTDPRGFLNRYLSGAIFDEFQLVPSLPSYLQQIVDSKDQKKLFILSGSQQLEIMSQVSQSLAGRTAVLKLLPFSIRETPGSAQYSVDDLILNGFYPRLYDSGVTPTLLYQSYFDTYIQRDLHQLISIQHLDVFQRFVRLCAGRVGQLFVASHLGNELGVSLPTIQSWLSILQASYIVFLLQPYHHNFNKRLIKTPKLYFYDVGLASYLLNLRTTEHVSREPLRGALFENLVILDALKTQFNQGQGHSLYFYRDRNQNEVDLIWDQGHNLTLFEIKSTQTFHSNLLKNLHYLQSISPVPISSSYLVYAGDDSKEVHNIQVVGYQEIDRILRQ